MRKSTTAEARKQKASDGLAALYDRPMPAKRTGALFTAFPYPTKISPEAIALFIASHTKPGDTVLDAFAGSGTTGLAALLCEAPTTSMRAEAKRLGLSPDWGPRNAVLYELGALGAFVGRTLTNPPDPVAFRKAANQILAGAEADRGWMYAATDPDGNEGTLRYIIWSDQVSCPGCRRKVTIWDACVSLRPANIASVFTCPHCEHEAPLDSVKRLTATEYDPLLDEKRALRARKPVRIHGSTGKKSWSRPPNKGDLALLKRLETERLPSSVPCVEIPWGDLHRSGYHLGITHLHHFYTRRNLIVFADLWERTKAYPRTMCDALRFWLLSYNASHATIMSRVVAKAGQDDLVTTSAQPGVLYVSGLPLEKNLFAGLGRKLKTIEQAFSTIRGSSGKVTVVQQSSCSLKLHDNSIDYVFTDPPFGGNIPYAEVNFLNEAWLNRFTDREEEIIVSKHQEKSVSDYASLMSRVFKELHRVLKPDGKATVVFHSATAEVWNALQSAYADSGFSVARASVLDKTQGSFKQVTTQGAVRGDPLLMLAKERVQTYGTQQTVWQVAERLHLEAHLASDPLEQTAQRLYSRLVNYFLSLEQRVPLDADTFYSWLAAKRAEVNCGAQAC